MIKPNKVKFKKFMMFFVRHVIFMGLAISLLQEVAVFHPSKELRYTPDYFNIEYKNVFVDVGGNVALNGWFLMNPKASSTLLFFHGNAGNIADRLTKLDYFYQLGLNVFIIDYRGFGQSQGFSTVTNMKKDAVKIYDYLRARKDVDASKIIVYGESLGGVPAVEVASQRAAGFLILDSTFTSTSDMARKLLPYIPSFLIYSRMNPLSIIDEVDCPKLFIHSREDEMIPFRQGLRLFQRASDPKEFVEIQGSHNEGFYLSHKRYVVGIREFLKTYGLI